MDERSLRDFARRDREPVRLLKEEYRREIFQTSAGGDTFRLGQVMREHARRVRPDWPSPAEREEDLEHHVELKRRIDGTANGFARR